MSPRVALATCTRLPEPDLDQELLATALLEAGLAPESVAWDGPPVDLAPFAGCVLRSTWNYHERPADFLAWSERAAARTRLWNAPSIVRWNHHKRYLLELEAEGTSIVPTALVPRGTRAHLAPILAERGWQDVVVKPAVSAGSFRTRRFRPGEQAAAQRFLTDLAAERDVLVQRYEPAVEERGERALVWIDGAFTHAVTKHPRFSGDPESVSQALPLLPREEAFGLRLLERLAGELLYARVDVIEDEDGSPRLSELELIEPSLFLLQSPAALERLVSAIARRATQPDRGSRSRASPHP